MPGNINVFCPQKKSIQFDATAKANCPGAQGLLKMPHQIGGIKMQSIERISSLLRFSVDCENILKETDFFKEIEINHLSSPNRKRPDAYDGWLSIFGV
jgi:hypothetical protein